MFSIYHTKRLTDRTRSRGSKFRKIRKNLTFETFFAESTLAIWDKIRRIRNVLYFAKGYLKTLEGRKVKAITE